MEPLKSSVEPDFVVNFRKFIQRFVQQFQPLQIYCFSQNTQQQHYQGCFTDEQFAVISDYCLLVVMDTATRMDHEMQNFGNMHYQYGSITIISNGTQTIMDAVRHNNRFFISVLRAGKLLYNKDGMLQGALIPQYISSTNSIDKANQQYAHRISLANGFQLCANECLEKDQLGISIFMLHQAVEQACTCLIRIYMDYRTEFHNLHRLLHLCQSFSQRPSQLFLATPEDRRLFEIMAKSYSASRYKDDFTVSRQDAEKLHQQVSSFLVLVKQLCQEKITSLEQDAARYAALKNSEAV